MAQNITLCGATYRAVPSVLLPKTGGGTATFVELSDQNGKVVKNGQLIEQGSLAVFGNGTYNTTEYGEVQVSVSNKEKAILDGSLTSYSNTAVQSLRPYALYRCVDLEDLTLANCRSVGDFAVALLSTEASSGSLLEVNLPKVETIGTNAFEYNSHLETVNAPLLESIGNYAFRNNSVLATFYAPNLDTIGTNAFQNCKALNNPTFGTLTTIKSSAFAYCNALPASKISFNAIETIESYAFRECKAFVSITAPKLKYIGTGGFNTCTNLERFDLGGGLTEAPTSGIGSNAFSGCTKINHFVIRYTGGVYPLAGNTAFGSTNSTPLAPSGAGYFYFPRDLVASYKTATNWKVWSNRDTRFRALEDYTVDGTVTGALDESKI